MPSAYAGAGIGTPDGTDVAGRIEPLAIGRQIMEGTFRSVLWPLLIGAWKRKEQA
jgi:hypothetical protein